LPKGVAAGPLRYPVPDRLIIAGLMNYVYERDYAQLVTLSVPAGIAAGTRLPIRARLDYLACTDKVCVPETSEIATELVVGTGAIEASRRARFDRWRQALPRPLGSPARFDAEGAKLRLAIPVPAALAIEEPYFFPLTRDALDYGEPQKFSRRGDLLIVELDRAADGKPPARLEGVLEIGPGEGLAVAARPGAVPETGGPLGGNAGLLLASLFAAILGGLLLNIMPCVFPILSLKAMSLARAGEGEAEARREALAYTAGIILTCLALGGAMLALRAGGAAVGWAFQLQDPRVILLLLLLVLAIALNLAGLFELPALSGGERLAQSGGTAGAFWTGVLAAFIATPCTGPFMGAALGAALVLPGAAALAIFAGLGLGLALPFLLLGFVPALRRRLPRPGPWMVRFRRYMSVPMFLTAIGLGWILGRQTGDLGLAIGVAVALVLGLSLWAVGRRQGHRRAWIPVLPAVAAGLAAVAAIPGLAAPQSAVAAIPGAIPFSEHALADLRARGRPTFVYFTADWCVTCKVNEKAVLQRREVAAAFARGNVAVLVGDWTRGDPAISRFLAAHGRSGVPLYLYYAPGKPPRILPQLLTVPQLVDLAA
jgi:thiol:disulfide interchange protein